MDNAAHVVCGGDYLALEAAGLKARRYMKTGE
jgi:hypothetical protein